MVKAQDRIEKGAGLVSTGGHFGRGDYGFLVEISVSFEEANAVQQIDSLV